LFSGLLMLDKLLGYGLQYAGYVLEVCLFALLLIRGQGRRYVGVLLYVVSFLAIDGVARPFVLYRYGLKSDQYAYCYWITDLLLYLTSFALVCSFFRRACLREEKMWQFVRAFLVFVFILIVTVSFFSISRNYGHVLQEKDRFIYQFEQNLFFTCLVLNTLLYITLQQFDSADEDLGLLVCGMGIQFAGPAANLALRLIVGDKPALSLFGYLVPVCNLGMLLIWLYAVCLEPRRSVVDLRTDRRKLPAFGAEARL